MKERLRKGSANCQFPQIPWAASPKRPYLGPSVEILGGFRRIRPATPSVDAALRAAPGIFFVASGLALQALGKDQLTSNLAMGKADGLFSKISLFKSKREITAAWGIDIGGSALKVIKLAKGEKSDEITVHNCDSIPFRLNLAHPEAEKQRSEIIREALQTFKDRHRPADTEVLCTNCPTAKTLIRVFNVPAVKGKKLAEIIQYEAAHHIPFPLAEMQWSYGIFEENRSENGSDQESPLLHRVVLVAARPRDVLNRLKEFEDLDMQIHLMQADPVALQNFVAFDVFDAFSDQGSEKPVGGSRCVAVLDIGSDSSNLLISSPRDVWIRTFRTGGNDIGQALAREFKVTSAQAEELKRTPSKCRRVAAVLQAMEPVLARIGGEFQRTIESYGKEFPEKRIESVWLCGGGSAQYGLLRYFRSGSPIIN
jgi:type IV pilus assembly protein PilM